MKIDQMIRYATLCSLLIGGLSVESFILLLLLRSRSGPDYGLRLAVPIRYSAGIMFRFGRE